MREILTNMIQVGIAIGAGEELDKDKEWHLERAEQQIEDFYRNKILEARAEGHHSGRYELTKELIPELEKNLTSFTAQLNKGDK